MVSALAFGSAAAWLALCGGPHVADNQAIEQVVANVPFEDARFACADASGVCATLYSQVCTSILSSLCAWSAPPYLQYPAAFEM